MAVHPCVLTLRKYLRAREPRWLVFGGAGIAALSIVLLMLSEVRVAWHPDPSTVALHDFISSSILHVASLVFVFGALGRALVLGRVLRVIGGTAECMEEWAEAALQVSVEPGPMGLVATLFALCDAACTGAVQPAGLLAWVASVGLLAALLACLALTAALVSNVGEGLALGVAWTPILFLLLRCGMADAEGFSSIAATDAGGMKFVLVVGVAWYALWRLILGRLLSEQPAVQRPAGELEGLPVAMAQLGLLILLATFSAAVLESGEERAAWLSAVAVGLGMVSFCLAFLAVSRRHACLRHRGAGEVLAAMPMRAVEWARLQARWTVVPALGYGAVCVGLGGLCRWLLDVPGAPDELWIVLPMTVAGLGLGFCLHPLSLSERPAPTVWTELARGVRLGLVAAAVVVGVHMSWPRPVVRDGHVMWSQTVGGAERLLSFDERQ